MTTILLSYRVIFRKINFMKFIPVNWKVLYGLGVAACLLLLIFYVISVNAMTKSYFIIKNSNQQIEGLKKEDRSLQIMLSEVNSLGEAESKAKELNFHKTSAIKYIQIGDNSLARAGK